MKPRRLQWLCRTLLWLAGAILCAMGTSPASAGPEKLENLFLDSKLILDNRYRFEFVDQDGFPKDAKANTVRTRAGLETGRFHGVGALFDIEWIEAIGRVRFNDTINGKVQFPTVADPDDFQVNQLYLIVDGTIPYTLVKAGRQRIIWDNARFIGNVGFRQNEQTFDSVRAIVTAVPDTEIEYVYLNEVQRIFGTDSAVGELDLDGHGVRLLYSGIPGVTIVPFALLLDYQSPAQAGLDLATYGVLVNGSHAISEYWRLFYAGSLAYQEDYGDNPADADLWYYQIEGGGAYMGVKLLAGYEVLQGDRTNAFQTPLATLHKFNGLTDRFLTTPPNGLEDFYVTLSAPLPGEGWLADLVFKAGYHQFWANRGGSHYGWEWDVGLFKKIATEFGTFDVGMQYASYDADSFSTDTDKLWFTVQFKAKPQPLRNYLMGEEG